MTDELTNADLVAIERRCDAATAGPWEFSDQRVLDYEGFDLKTLSLVTRSATQEMPNLVVFAQSDHCCEHTVALSVDREDRVFIAAARTDLPTVVAALRESRAQLAEVTAELEHMQMVAAFHGAHLIEDEEEG